MFEELYNIEEADHIMKNEDGKVDFNSIELTGPVDHSSFCYWPSYLDFGVTVKTITDSVKKYRRENNTSMA